MDYSGLNKEQTTAVQSDHHRILCLAGAGTGKTRVLTYRIARLIEEGVEPGEILALTFTRAAGAEMKERIIKLVGEDGRDIFCNTFHAWAVKLIRQHSFKLGRTPSFTIYDTEDKTDIIEQIIQDMQYNIKAKKVLDAMDKQTYYRVPIPEGEIEHIVNEYKFRCEKNNAFDLDGLITAAEYLLKDETIQAATRETWPFIFVDEFQDTDQRQMAILDAINPHNLFIVGDDFQNIYSFRGADVSIIMDMATNPEYEVVKLEQNYRSTKPIIDAANMLIKHNNQTEKILRTDRDGKQISVIHTADQKDELDMVTAIVEEQLQNGVKPEEIAILGRTNRQIQAVEKHLTDNGINCEIRAKSADALESYEAKKIFAWMEAILNPQNDATIETVINWPNKTMQQKEKNNVEMYALENNCSLKTALEATETAIDFLNVHKTITDWIEESYDEDEEVSAADLLDHVIKATQIVDFYNQQGLKNHIDTLKEIRNDVVTWQEHQVEIGEVYTAAEWLERYRTRMLETDSLNNDHEGAVQIMTAHGSKGLEFECVIIAGCNNKTFPLSRAEIEDERRLFYVAMTRAKNNLYLTRASEKVIKEDITEETEISQFIEEANI